MLQKWKLKIFKTRLKIEPACSIPITKVFPFRQFSSDCFITRVSTHSLCRLARVGKRRKERNRKNFFWLVSGSGGTDLARAPLCSVGWPPPRLCSLFWRDSFTTLDLSEDQSGFVVGQGGFFVDYIWEEIIGIARSWPPSSPPRLWQSTRGDFGGYGGYNRFALSKI